MLLLCLVWKWAALKALPVAAWTPGLTIKDSRVHLGWFRQDRGGLISVRCGLCRVKCAFLHTSLHKALCDNMTGDSAWHLMPLNKLTGDYRISLQLECSEVNGSWNQRPCLIFLQRCKLKNSACGFSLISGCSVRRAAEHRVTLLLWF